MTSAPKRIQDQRTPGASQDGAAQDCVSQEGAAQVRGSQGGAVQGYDMQDEPAPNGIAPGMPAASEASRERRPLPWWQAHGTVSCCLLYTSDAADE
mgnify:CR=1 FL=1